MMINLYLKIQKIVVKLPGHIQGTSTYIYHEFKSNVGKSCSPMAHLGLVLKTCHIVHRLNHPLWVGLTSGSPTVGTTYNGIKNI